MCIRDSHVIQWPARRMPFDARRYFCPQHRFYRTASKYFYQFARRAFLNLSLYQEETTAMNLLTVTNLSAGYAGKQVIKDISFFVAPKTIVGILGANAVSYTHLDVYKRQPQKQCSQLICFAL